MDQGLSWTAANTQVTQVIRSHKEDYLRAGARDLFFFFFDFLFFFFFRSFRL